MNDQKKTKEQLINELVELRQRVKGLGAVEAELRRAETKHTAIIETALGGFWITDLKGRFLNVNASYCRMTGYSREELLSMSVSDIEASEKPGETAQHLKNVMEQGYAHFETHHRRKDDKIIDLEVSAQYYDAEGGQLVIFLQDITERREIENGLERARKELEVIKQSEDEAREYAESIINTVREPLIALDQDLRVVKVSRSFYDFFKVKPEETMRQLIYDLGNKQWDIPKLRDLLETILPQKASFDNYEVEHDFATIGRRVMLLNARQIQRVLGKERIILLAIEDITERKRTQEVLAQQAEALASVNTELTAANKELEAFAYSVSHDLRAPLRGIDGFSQALLEDCADKLNEQGRDHVQRVRSAAQRMGELIDDLLALSRVTRSEMKQEMVDLSAIAQSIAAGLRETEPKRQVKFVIAEGLTVKGDAVLLRTVLENLLGNAWKFTGKQPKARIELGVTQNKGKPMYFVRDDGVGFDMTYVDKLFAPFQRLHSVGEFSGTGIGLATVQRIIHRHGGRVWGEGRVGEGATFYFTLG